MVYERTGKMPTALATRPTIPPHLIEYWNGFVALDRTRPLSYGGPAGIRYSEILAYSQLQGFSLEDMDEFASIINLLDSRYMELQAEHGKT